MDTDSSMFDNGAAVDTTAFDSAFAPVAGPSSKPAFFQLQESSSEGGSSASGSEYEESEEEMQEDNVPADEAQEAAGGTGKSTDEDNLDKLIRSVFHGQSREALLNPQGQAGALGESWDQSIKDVLDDLEDQDVGPISTTRSGRRRKGKRRHVKPRSTVALSPEVQSMLSAANSAYMTREYDAAVSLLQEIIRIEPAARPAYHTLSAIHTELGNHDKSLQLDILAAHLSGKSPDLWKDLGTRSKDVGLLQQAVYCFTQAIQSTADREDVDALWDRSSLYVELGQNKRAARGFTELLDLHPHDPNIVRQLVPLLIGQSDAEKALRVLSDAFADQVARFPEGPYSAPGFEILLELSDLQDLVELQKTLKQYMDAVRIIRTGQRWLQGRATQGQAWELYEDDREYDLERKSRPHWEDEERLRWLEDLPIVELDPTLRGNLAICRLLSGNKGEADTQLQIIRTLDVYEYPQVFGELADTYFDKKHYEEALELYYDLADCEATNTPAVWTRVAQCNRHLGKTDVAAECFEAVIETDPSDLNVKLQLAEVYDELGRREEALDLVNQVLEARRLLRQEEEEAMRQQADLEDAITEAGDEDPSSTFFQEGRRRKSAAAKRMDKRKVTREQRLAAENQRQEDIQLGFDRLQRIEDDMMDPTSPEKSKEWIDAASYLVDSFRETPAFFPSDGKYKFKNIIPRNKRKLREQRGEDLDAEADDLAERLQRAMADEDEEEASGEAVEEDKFCNVSFDDWLKLAIRYAFALTMNGEYGEADECLRHICTSAVCKEPENRLQAMWFALAICAYHAGEGDAAMFELRQVLKANDFSDEVLRTMQAMFTSGHAAMVGWSGVNHQKFVLRTVKMFDKAANVGVGGSAKINKKNSRQASPDEDEDDDDAYGAFQCTKVDPYFLVQYSNVLLACRSYSSAIFYYIRLLDLYPEEPLFQLLAGVAFLLRSTQRQTDNKHYMIAQAMACFSQYRKHRGKPAEANYNFGRAFHQMSLRSLAIKHYEAVLSEERQRLEEGLEPLEGGLAKYAAYNLYQIFLSSGLRAPAQNVVDEWLTM